MSLLEAPLSPPSRRSVVCLVVFSFAVAIDCFETHTSGSRSPHTVAFRSPHGYSSSPIRKASSVSPEDNADQASFLPLSSADLDRLSELQSRQLTMPIMFLDAMVPKQSLTFQSADPKFRRLMEACLEYDEIGMLGLSPTTRRPLCHGVTIPTSPEYIQLGNGTSQLTATADRRIEVLGEPWLDETQSYYMATVELLDEREEVLSEEQFQRAQKLSQTLPDLVKEWKTAVLDSAVTDPAGLEARSVGEIPSELDLTARAFWIAALINPLPALGVSLEIRPAMLSCENDYQRILLACQAIQASIHHVTGKRRLF